MDTRLGTKKHVGHVPKQRLMSKLFRGIVLGIFLFSTFISPLSPLLDSANARFLETRMVPGQMVTTREGFSATLITAGIHEGKILVAGGFDGQNYLNTAELYNPRDGRFTQLAGAGKTLSTARAYHQAIALSDGKILFVGGQSDASTTLSSMEIYNPSTQNFESYYNMPANVLPTLADDAKNLAVSTFTSGADQFVVIAGGENAAGTLRNKVYVYDISNNTIAQATGTLTTARTELSAILYPNAGTQGQILFIGGKGGATNAPLRSLEKFDVQTRTVSTVTAQLTQERLGAVVENFDNPSAPRVLVAGGQRTLTGTLNTSAEIITFAAGNFVVTAVGTSLATARKDATAVVGFEDSTSTSSTKKLYIFGGRDATGKGLRDFEKFDVTTLAFQAASGPMLTAGRYAAKGIALPVASTDGAVANNGQFTIIGGKSDASTILRTAEMFDMQRFQYTSSAMLFPRSFGESFELSANPASPNFGKTMIVGGINDSTGAVGNVYSGTEVKQVELYNPVTNTFEDLCPSRDGSGNCTDPAKEMRAGRYGFTATQMQDGKIYFIGGKKQGNPAGFFADPGMLSAAQAVEVFDPATETFTALTPGGAAFASRAFHAAVPISSTEILLSGGSTFGHSSFACVVAGFSVIYCETGMLGDLMVYNTQTNEFRSLTSTITPRYGHKMVSDALGDVYVIGGGQTSIYKVNVTADTATVVAASGPAQAFGEVVQYNNLANTLIYGGNTDVSYVAGFMSGGTSVSYRMNYGPSNAGITTSTLYTLGAATTTAGPTFSDSMTTPKAAQIDNGKFILTGPRAYQWDPASPASISAPIALKTTRTGFGLTKLTGNANAVHAKGKLLAFGGANITEDRAETYDPENQTPDKPVINTPSALQEFTDTRRPRFEFTGNDREGDELIYQVQIAEYPTGVFPADDAVNDPDNLSWNFAQMQNPTGFDSMTGFDGLYFESGMPANFDFSLLTDCAQTYNCALPNSVSGKDYQIRVRSYDAIGGKKYSAWSDVVRFRINTETNAPTSTLNALNTTYNDPNLVTIGGTATDDTDVEKVRVAVKDITTPASPLWWNGSTAFSATSERFDDASLGGSAPNRTWMFNPLDMPTALQDGHTYEVTSYALDVFFNEEVARHTTTFTYDSAFVPTTITVTSPNGGESLVIGQPQNLTWSTTGIPSTYDVFYSKDDFATEIPVVTGLSGALTSYSWTVPNDTSSNVRIKVVAKDAGGATLGEDISDGAFSISNNGGDTTAPTVTITSPVNGTSPASISSIMGTHNDPTAASVKVTIRDVASGDYWNGTAFAPAASEDAAKQDVTGTGSPWSYATNSIPFTNGQSYEFKAYVKDPVGNEGVATSTVTFGTSGNSNTNGTGNTNTNGTSNGNTNSGTGNSNQNTGGGGSGTGTGGSEVVCPSGYIFFSGGCIQYNPFQQPTTTQPTPAPIIITTPSSSQPSYPYPYPTYTAPTPTPNQNTTTPDTSAPLATITFPATGANPTTLSSIQGNSQDAGGSGVYYVEVELFDETTGRYFDGSAFNSTARQAYLAQGGSVWSLAVPNSAFVNGHRYSISAKAKDNAGNAQEMPSKVTITYAGTGESENLNPAAPAQTNVNANTAPATTENSDDLLARLDRMLASIEAMANKPVNVTVSNPTAASTTPRVVVQSPTAAATPAAPSTSSATVNNGTPATTGTTTGTGATYVNSNGNSSYDTYDQQYNDYLGQNPEANRNPSGYDTQGLRDTDGDGLSDYIELRLGTDPFKKDTDNDGYSDGEEVLEYGTNPLDPNSVPNLNGVGITNIDSKLLTSDKTPFITGYAKPGSQVVLYDVLPDGTKREIGTGVADARGRYVISPEVPLGDGKHYLATGIKDKNGDLVDMSAVKEVEVDSTLTIPVPEVEDIKITNKKPIVFGKTQYGTTVVAHFQSLVTSSSVVADTTAGDFIVTSASPLEIGNHKVTLYAMLPNGARSEEITVPFEVSENDNDILNPSMFKADVSEAGDASIWWLLGALIPLLLLAALLVYMLLNKRDTVIYSVTPKQLGDVENTKVGQTFAYQSDLSVTKADLTTDYVAFYLLKGEESEHVTFSEFKSVKEETICLIARIIEEKFILEREEGNVEFTKESIDMDDLPKYKIHYVFEVISTEAKPMAKFIGKRYALAKNLIHDVALLEHNKAEHEEEHIDTAHKA